MKMRDVAIKQREFFRKIKMKMSSSILSFFKKDVVVKDPSKIDDDLDEPNYFTQIGDVISSNRPTTIKAFNFGWLIKGNAGSQFIIYLAQQKSDSYLFESETVKNIIQVQWLQFKR